MILIWYSCRVLLYICWYRCFFIIGELLLPAPFKIFGVRKTSKSQAKRFSKLLIALGPSYIKLGQLLSLQSMIIGDIFANELAKLQDTTNNCKFSKIDSILKKELGEDYAQLFIEIDKNPIASASIAQIHYAVLKNNHEKVAIKVIKPYVKKLIHNELKFIKACIYFIDNFTRSGKRIQFKNFYSVLEEHLNSELNLRLEASAMNQMRDHIKDIPNVVIPTVFLEHSRQTVLIMEWIEGAKINDTDFIKQHNLNPKKIAYSLCNVFFYQVLDKGFFHADLHPGNVLINTRGEVVLLDFGIMCYLSSKSQSILILLSKAFIKRDYNAFARIHFLAGWVNDDYNSMQFSIHIRSIIDDFSYNYSLADALSRLIGITSAFNMRSQSSVLLLQKNLLLLQRILSCLVEDTNIWLFSKGIIMRRVGQKPSSVHIANLYQEQVKHNMKNLNDKLNLALDRFTSPQKKITWHFIVIMMLFISIIFFVLYFRF